MIKNFAFKWGILFFVFLVILGCASLPRPDEMKAQVANYQLPRLPDEGKAIVYVVNPSSFAKHASKSGYMFEVFLDNNDPQSEVGATMGQQYTYFNITPGEHKILSKAGNWAEIKVSAKAGDIIFIQQEPYMGFTTLNIKLLNLQDYEGKYYVKTLPQGRIIGNNQANVATASIASPSASAIPSGNQNILGITVGPTSGVRGVRVITVASGSPCESVLKPGDAIFALTLIGQGNSIIGGARVNTDNFQAEVLKIQPGMTVKLMVSSRPVVEVSCTIPEGQSNAPRGQAQNAKEDTFIGTVTGGNFAKGIGFSNINIKLEVTADNGVKDIFFVRSDSKVFDVSGNQIDYEKTHGIKGRKIEIEYFIITDATGGDPSRSDFAFEIGQKGVRVMRLFN
jgi:hypothetical protein